MIDSKIFDTAVATPFRSAVADIRNGDLLLCSGNSFISQAIKQTTKSVFSHVALILFLPVTEQYLVLESVESIGVRCVTLNEGYLTNYMDSGKGYPGRVLVARHAQMAAKAHLFAKLYDKAFSLLGDRYNEEDIFRIAVRYSLAEAGIDEQGELQGANSYICSEYVYVCLKAIGIDLPFNALGFIAPADIANAPEVSAVLQLAVG